MPFAFILFISMGYNINAQTKAHTLTSEVDDIVMIIKPYYTGYNDSSISTNMSEIVIQG